MTPPARWPWQGPIWLRRFLVLIALMFWQGGFTFYTGVVVPIGTNVLGSAEEQGWITRRVTGWLNLAGVVTLAVVAWDIAAGGDPVRLRRRLRWALWLALAAALGLLVWLHPRLDALMDPEQAHIVNRPEFRRLHRYYLWISTLQWTVDLPFLLLMLRAWQGEDEHRARRPPA
jgi:hypothetical protein